MMYSPVMVIETIGKAIITTFAPGPVRTSGVQPGRTSLHGQEVGGNLMCNLQYLYLKIKLI